MSYFEIALAAGLVGHALLLGRALTKHGSRLQTLETVNAMRSEVDHLAAAREADMEQAVALMRRDIGNMAARLYALRRDA